MKSLVIRSVTAVALLGSLAAFGVVRPGWERPLLKAQLTQLSAGITYPRAQSITLNRRDGARRATSFSLYEDTGIRCITTPCPSHRTTQFSIIDVQRGPAGSIKYIALEVLPPIPPARLPVQRRLEVLDYSKSILEIPVQHLWQVTVTSPEREPVVYGGNPAPVYTPQEHDVMDAE